MIIKYGQSEHFKEELTHDKVVRIADDFTNIVYNELDMIDQDWRRDKGELYNAIEALGDLVIALYDEVELLSGR